MAAEARFCRSCGAQRLDETVAVAPAQPVATQPTAAPPPSPARQRRGVSIAVLVALVIVFGIAGGTGAYFLVVKPGDSDQGQAAAPAPSDTPAPSEGADAPASTDSSDAATTTRDAFSIDVPDGWPATERDVDKGYGIRNTWTGPRGATVLVDYTRGFKGTSLSAARELRANARKADGYAEVAFEQIALGGKDMVRWQFVKDGEEKVDYFTDACGTGYAVLGSANADRFSEFESDFRHAAETMEPTC